MFFISTSPLATNVVADTAVDAGDADAAVMMVILLLVMVVMMVVEQ